MQCEHIILGELWLRWSQHLVTGKLQVQFPMSACQSGHGQDTEPQTVPDVLVGTLHTPISV